MLDRSSSTHELESAVEDFYKHFPYPLIDEFASQFALDFEMHCARKFKKAPSPLLSEAIAVAVVDLYAYEAPKLTFERRTWFIDPVVDPARYRDHLLGLLKFKEKNHHDRLAAFKELLTAVFEPLIAALPPAACITAEHEPRESPTQPLYSMLHDLKGTIEAMLAPYAKVAEELEEYDDGRMGAVFAKFIIENIKQRKPPLADTPVGELFDAQISVVPEEPEELPLPPEIPLPVRFQGQWVIGTPGTGKTQLFQFMLSRDLDLVAQGKASIVVLDPTGVEGGRQPSLIHNLITLQRFAPGGDLHGKLVYIDPQDRSHTLPINLLSLRASLDDEEAVSSAISSYLSIMGGLMGQPLTNFQEPVFRFAVQVALAFPNPNLSTLREIIALPPPMAKGAEPPPKIYEQVLHKLDPDVAAYMREVYDTDGPKRSRTEILNRLYTLSSDPMFRRLFHGSETKIDFSDEINQPKVIVINAARDYLQSFTELYGRYFLALITQAGERRSSQSIPCFIYIDECDEFVASDQNASKILLKLRRKNMALILGNQLVSRITDASVQQSFLGTAIKFVNADHDSALDLAKAMNCITDAGRPDPSFLQNRPSLNFAFHLRGQMPKPVAVQVPGGFMESQPHMTDAEFARVRQEIRDRYYVPTGRAEIAATTATPPPQKEESTSDLLARGYQALAVLTQRGEWAKVKELKASIANLEERLETERNFSDASGPILKHVLKDDLARQPVPPEVDAEDHSEGGTGWR